MSSPSPLNKGIPERGIGILCLIGSLVFIYLGIYQPISDAAHHEPTVSLSMKAAIIAPLVFALGITFTVLGDKTTKYLGPRNQLSKLGWAFFIFFTILGILVYWWVQTIVKSYGYSG
jgi:multisubunit Na+/H+ antiporter MnhB subunit